MRILTIFIIFIFALTGCGTNAVVSDEYVSDPCRFGETIEKEPIRMINVEGALYYDSGITASVTEKSETPDGEFSGRVASGRVPKNSGECNFKGADGWQNSTSITKVVPIDGEWIIFKKFESFLAASDYTPFEYCHYIKGRLNNAAAESELVVLSEKKDITYSQVHEPMLSSHSDAGKSIGPVSYSYFSSQDSLGIRLSVDEVTPTGLKMKIEQFAGTPSGELQTDSRYLVEKSSDGEWIPAESLSGEEPAWNDMAYKIKKNDITEINIDWQNNYGSLASGYYRLIKEITDFRKSNDYDTKRYEVHFTIE